MAGNYAWRDCAGRTSDAIQFAAQMGFVERDLYHGDDVGSIAHKK